MGTESVSSDQTHQAQTTPSRDVGELEVGGGAEWMRLLDHTSTTPGLNVNIQLTQHRQASDFFWGVRADGTLFGSALLSDYLSADHNSQIRGLRGDLSLIIGTHLSRTPSFNARLFGGLGLHGGNLTSPADSYLTPADTMRIGNTSAGGRGFTEGTAPTDTRTGQNGLYTEGLTLHREGYFFGGHAILGLTAEFVPAHFFLSAVGTLGGSAAIVDGHHPGVDSNISIGPKLGWSALAAAGFRFGDSSPVSLPHFDDVASTPAPVEAPVRTPVETPPARPTPTESTLPSPEPVPLPDMEAPTEGQPLRILPPPGGWPAEATQAFVLDYRLWIVFNRNVTPDAPLEVPSQRIRVGELNHIQLRDANGHIVAAYQFNVTPRRPVIQETPDTSIILGVGTLDNVETTITRPATVYNIDSGYMNMARVADFVIPGASNIPAGTSIQVRLEGQNVGSPIAIPAQIPDRDHPQTSVAITIPANRLTREGGRDIIADGPHNFQILLNINGQAIRLRERTITIIPPYASLGQGSIDPAPGRSAHIFVRHNFVVRFHADRSLTGSVHVVIGNYQADLGITPVGNNTYTVSVSPEAVLTAHHDHLVVTDRITSRQRWNYTPENIRIQVPGAPESTVLTIRQTNPASIFRSQGRHRP